MGSSSPPGRRNSSTAPPGYRRQDVRKREALGHGRERQSEEETDILTAAAAVGVAPRVVGLLAAKAVSHVGDARDRAGPLGGGVEHVAAHGLVEPAGEDGPQDVAPLRPHLRGAVLLILLRGRRGWCAVGVCGRRDRLLRCGRDVLDQTDPRSSAQLRSARRSSELAHTTPRAAPMNPRRKLGGDNLFFIPYGVFSVCLWPV